MGKIFSIFTDFRSVMDALAGIIFFLSLAVYALDILKTRHLQAGNPDKAEPMKGTWLVWLALDTTTAAAQIAKHALSGQMIGTLLGGYVVLVLALIYGKPGWNTSEKRSLVGAAIGIGLWYWLSSPQAGLLVFCIVGIVGSIPTFQSAYNEPTKESKNSWMIMFISCVCALLAVSNWNLRHFEYFAQQVEFTAIEGVMVYLTWIRPRFTAARN